MDRIFKPNGYNSLSTYLVVDGARKLADLLINKAGDPDIRGAFMDFAGNY